MTDEELDLLAVLVRIGREDRALYRQLRAEIWRMAAERHRAKSPGEHRDWLAEAS